MKEILKTVAQAVVNAMAVLVGGMFLVLVFVLVASLLRALPLPKLLADILILGSGFVVFVGILGLIGYVNYRNEM